MDIKKDNELKILKEKVKELISVYYRTHSANEKGTAIADNICRENDIYTHVEKYLNFTERDVITSSPNYSRGIIDGILYYDCDGHEHIFLNQYYCGGILFSKNYMRVLSAGYFLLNRETKNLEDLPLILEVIDTALLLPRNENKCSNVLKASIYMADNLLMPEKRFRTTFKNYRHEEQRYIMMENDFEVEKMYVECRAKRLGLLSKKNPL